MSGKAMIEIEGSHRRIAVDRLDKTLAEIMADAGSPLNTRCNQRGVCRGCHVVEKGGVPKDLLACQHHLADGDILRIAIPARSLLSHPPSVVSDFQTGVPVGDDPIFTEPGTLGIAVDIGTTTVAMILAELDSGNPHHNPKLLHQIERLRCGRKRRVHGKR